MSKENEMTLEAYQKTAKDYINNSMKHDALDIEKAKRKRKKLNEFIRKSLEGLPTNAKIFEIGSADGENAKYIQTLGYDVTASDVADDFIAITKSQGVRTIRFNALKDDFPEKYFGIFAWRVFVHFTKEDALNVLQKTYDALEDNGRFIFNAMNREERGIDEEWVDLPGEYHIGIDRYYSYYSEELLNRLIGQTPYRIEHFHKEGGDNGDKWFVYVLKK